MSDKKLSRKEIEQESRKAYILEKAEVLFAEKGYENTSMAMIAERSEFSVGTVYNFFPSKQDIYSEIFFSKLSAVRNLFQEALSSDMRAIDKIREIGRVSMKHFSENRTFFMIYQDDINRFDWHSFANFNEKVVKHINQMNTIMINLFDRAKDEGDIRKDIDSHYLAIIGKKISHAFVFSRIQSEEDFDIEKTNELMFDVLMNGIGSKK